MRDMHGPHHEAQKSSSTALWHFTNSASEVWPPLESGIARFIGKTKLAWRCFARSDWISFWQTEASCGLRQKASLMNFSNALSSFACSASNACAKLMTPCSSPTLLKNGESASFQVGRIPSSCVIKSGSRSVTRFPQQNTSLASAIA